MSEETNHSGENSNNGKKKNHRKKNKEEREESIPKEYLQIYELIKMSGLSKSKIRTAIKNNDLKTSQTCKRGIHLIHITEAKQWLQGKK